MGNSSAAQYRKAQEIMWGEAGAWAHDTFNAHNARHFDGQVPHHGIAWGLTPHGGRLGHTAHDGRITLHPALLDPRSDAWKIERFLGEAYASDVVLHEMIHVLLFARGVSNDGTDPHHNTVEWCAEIMRLAPLLGLGALKAAPVKPRRVDGKVVRQALNGHLSRDGLARFPHSLRPDGFYGAVGRLPVRI